MAHPSLAGLVTVMAVTFGLARGAGAQASSLPAPVPGGSRTFGLVIENDALTGDDSGYTSGFGAIGSLGPFPRFDADNVLDLMLPLVERTWIATLPNRSRARAYALSQVMQTPPDITVAAPQPNELPWAAALTADMVLYAFDDDDADRLTLTVGVVGPWALGEQSQTLVHEAIGSDEPLGWDNQLDNELVLRAEAARSRRMRLTGADGSMGTDLVLGASGALGNLSSGAAASVVARVGRALETTHATVSLVPNRQVNPTVFGGRGIWYAFVGAELRFVANDLLVQGNTFDDDGPGVTLDRTRVRVSLGASADIGPVGISLVYARFPGNIDDDAFGALALTWRY